MKSKFTFLILFIGFISYCQSNTEQRDPINQQDFESMLVSNNSSIVISKYKSSTINEITLILKTETETCNDNHGISLTLFTGEKLNFKNNKIACSESEKKRYKLSGSLILTPELYNKLSQTEIIEFNLGGVIVPVNFKEKGENLRALFKFSESY
jgi:thioredoxin-related protein